MTEITFTPTFSIDAITTIAAVFAASYFAYKQISIMDKQKEIFEQAIHQFMEITGAGVNILGNQVINNNKNTAERICRITKGDEAVLRLYIFIPEIRSYR